MFHTKYLFPHPTLHHRIACARLKTFVIDRHTTKRQPLCVWRNEYIPIAAFSCSIMKQNWVLDAPTTYFTGLAGYTCTQKKKEVEQPLFTHKTVAASFLKPPTPVPHASYTSVLYCTNSPSLCRARPFLSILNNATHDLCSHSSPARSLYTLFVAPRLCIVFQRWST